MIRSMSDPAQTLTLPIGGQIWTLSPLRVGRSVRMTGAFTGRALHTTVFAVSKVSISTNHHIEPPRFTK